MLMLRRWFAGILSSLFFAPAFAQAPLPAGMTRGASVEGITEYRLANGLQLLLVPDDSKPTTTVNMTYHVGSRHENYGETGMAHLLEHLIFKGTPTTRNVLAELSRRGMRANGTTSFDRTNYFASFAADDENLRWYLSWQADAMVNSFIARADLDTEMTVVRNEMEAGENSPFRILLQQTMAAMYQWHNYGKSIIGARSDVENVEIANLQAFYRRHYQPDNATLIVAGRFDRDKVLGWVAQSFGPIPRPSRRLPPTWTLDPVQDGERAVTLRRAGGAPVVMAAFHVPPGASPDFAAASLLSQVLGQAPSGRLHKRLVERGLAASVFGFAWGLAEPGPFLIGAQLAPNQDAERARAELLATVESLAAEPVTTEELERARTQWINSWERGFTDPEVIGVALSDAIARGDWRLYFLDRDLVRRTTLADINRVATQHLRRDNRTVGVFLPTTQPERAPAPARVDVAALVKDYRGDAAAAQAEAFDPTPAQLEARTRRSKVGALDVALLPKSARGRVVQARLRLHFGDERSLLGQEMTASFAGSLFDDGGAGLTRQQLRDRFDALRAQVSFGIDEQVLTVNITTVREHLPETVALVARVLREPAFPADALEELRRQWLAALERDRREPGAVVANALARHGNPHPRGDLRYVSTFDESVEDAKAVTREKVVEFHRRFVSAARGEFSASGDFDPAALRAALEKGFADWRQPAAGPLAYARVPRPLTPVKAERFMLATPDKQNANLAGGQSLALNDLHPDYPAMLLANFMFGGGTSSRLWMRVREREGLSYDVRSVVDWNPVEPNSRLALSAIFAPQNQPRVEAAIREEAARLLREGFGAAELAQAKTALANQRRLARAQDAVVANALATNLHLGRTFTISQQVDEAIARATLDEVNAAWRRHVDPAAWTLVWGGDFKAP